LARSKAARLGHGTGDVDHERQGGGRAFVGVVGGAGGEAYADEGPVGAVGAGAVDGDREAVAVGAVVVLAEAVDELLGADRGRVGAFAVGEDAAGVAVGGGVDVEGEGGEVVGGRGDLVGGGACLFAVLVRVRALAVVLFAARGDRRGREAGAVRRVRVAGVAAAAARAAAREQ
jgi:hypothetical protein